MALFLGRALSLLLLLCILGFLPKENPKVGKAYFVKGKSTRFNLGVAVENFGTSDDTGRGVAVQDNGRIVVAGYGNDANSSADFAVIRFLPDGTLDTSFHTDGKVTTAVGTAGDIAHAITLDTQNRIIAAGYSHDGSNKDLAVVRYLTSGALDTTFNNDGKNTFKLADKADIIRAVLEDSLGRIVLAGRLWDGSNDDYDVVVARLLTNGSMDTNFHTDGHVVIESGAQLKNNAFGMVLHADDRIIISGDSVSGTDGSVMVARLLTSGAFDTTFSTDGVVTNSLGSRLDRGWAVDLGTNNTIVVAGRHYTASNYDMTVLRYFSNGAMDTTFSTDGVASLAIGSANEVARSLAVYPDGKIVVGGASNDGTSANFAVARFLGAGGVDTTFGTNGVTTTVVEIARDDKILSVALKDSKIVVAGYTSNANNKDLIVARYNDDGLIVESLDLDANFHTDGIVETDIGASSADTGVFIAEDSQGRIVMGGESANSFAAVRYLTDGAMDTVFSADGEATVSIGTDDVGAGVVDSADRIILVGDSSNDFAVVRFLTSGAIDTTWSTDGQVTTDVGSTTTDDAYGVDIDLAGKIVVVGSAGTTAGIVRYFTDGALDTTFSTDGRATVELGTAEAGRAIVVDSDGRYVMAGVATDNGAIVRFLTDGNQDTTFNTDGIVTINVAASDAFYAVAVDSQHRIVAAGEAASDVLVVRYLSDGNLDTTFSTDGKVTLDVGSTTTDTIRGVQIQPNDKIVIVGDSADDFLILRYKTDGSLDDFPSANQTQSVGTTEDGYSVFIQTDGGILLGGTSDNDFSALQYFP